MYISQLTEILLLYRSCGIYRTFRSNSRSFSVNFIVVTGITAWFLLQHARSAKRDIAIVSRSPDSVLLSVRDVDVPMLG